MTEGCSIPFLGRRHSLAPLKRGGATPRARPWRAVENRGLNKIQKYFRRISLNSKWIQLAKKNWVHFKRVP